MVEFFVAADGNDGWDGSRVRPFATFEKAREAVRQIKQAGPMPVGGVTVTVRAGVYPRTDTFSLTAEDSGTAEAPVVYRAAEGETVRLVGGKPVTGWVPVTDQSVLQRLDPTARGKVLQVDLKAQGITDFGTLQSRGFGRPTTPSHLELFFDGKAMTLARWPNQGFSTIQGYPGAGENDGHGTDIGKLENGYNYEGDRPAHWQQTGDIWAHGYWAWDWANSYERIERIDVGQRLITTAPPQGLYGFRDGQRVYYLNILEELDQPGEYYLDRPTGMLYFWPPAMVEDKECYVSLLEAPMVDLQDASHVTLQGFTLEYMRGTAIVMEGGEGNTIDGCTVRNAGNYSVNVQGGHRHRVTGCEIYSLGDGGILLNGGDRKTLEPGGHEAVNNHIHHIAQWSICYQPAVMLFGVGNRVAHNHIHDHPHCPVLIHGNDHLIEYNDIHHVALETGDVGAFYIGRDWAQQGNVVRYNFFHETGGVGMGSMAVYLDDCSSGVTTFGNIFYRTHWAVLIGGGRDNIVENNIFVECQPTIHLDARGINTSPTWQDMVYGYMKQRLDEANHHQPPYSERYPKLAELDQYYAVTGGIPSEGNIITRNICLGGEFLEISWGAEPELQQISDNLVDVDPHFVDPDQLNFQLKDDSPAYKLGFQRIPVEKIGIE